MAEQTALRAVLVDDPVAGLPDLKGVKNRHKLQNLKRQKDRRTERQKDRKTERQKDRKTEIQKDRKTER